MIRILNRVHKTPTINAIHIESAQSITNTCKCIRLFLACHMNNDDARVPDVQR